MASTTVRYEADAVSIKIGSADAGYDVHNNLTSHRDPVLRTIAQEYATNGTTAGVVTITAQAG